MRDTRSGSGFHRQPRPDEEPLGAAALRSLQRAADRFGAGDLPAAETACRELLQQHPQSVDVLHLLALIRKRAGRLGEAETLFRDCLQRDPERVDILANLANLLAAAARYEEAERAYRCVLARDHNFRLARLGLARVLLRTGRYEEAHREARRLIDRNHQDGDAWTVAGTALRALDDSPAAESALRQALSLRPDDGIARHNLGALLAGQGQSGEALEELQRAAAAGVRGPELDFNVASSLMSLHRFDEAEAMLADAVAKHPRDQRAHRLLAKLRYMRGDPGFAEPLRRALAEHPEDVALRLALAQTLRGAGEIEASFALLRDASEPRLLAERAALCIEAGDYAAARAAAEAAVAAEPDNDAFRDVLLDSLLVLGDAATAMPLIARARRRHPLNQWYVAMEATAARLLGDRLYEELYDYDRLVRVFDLEAPPGYASMQEFHAALAEALRARHRFRARPLDQSLRGGTQTARGLLGDDDPSVVAFLSGLPGLLAEYCADVGRDSGHAFRARNSGAARLTGCWSVRLQPGGYHVNHVHPEGWISSAYYVEVPPGVGSGGGRDGWLKFGEPRYPVPGAGVAHAVQPRPGRLVLFPSYMWHGTYPFEGDAVRTSIAFDALPATPA